MAGDFRVRFDFRETVSFLPDYTLARGRGVSVAEEPENGSITGARLMRLADTIASGEAQTAPALADARAAIEDAATA